VIRLCAALAAMAVAGAMAAAPERVADGNAIVSHRDPALRIALSQPVQYAGADRFVLLGMADCELHAFVEADARKSVRRLYWIQFEQYLPSRPELAHAYNSPRHATLGGMDFYVDTWVSKRLPAEPGSDVEHLRALLRKDGYTLPPGMVNVRFVHLLDKAKRKELMIIYGEDPALAGGSLDGLPERAARGISFSR